MPVEDEYLDVFQNIEASIVEIYRDYPDLTDYQVQSAFEALQRTYQGEISGRSAVLPRGEQSRIVYSAVKSVCEWRLGRVQAVDEEEQPLSLEPLTVDEIITVIKRLRKSVDTWNKQSGTQGYLNYIRQFIR